MKVAVLQGHTKAQIIFFYNASVIEAIKTITGWSFDMVCKKWYIPCAGVEELLKKLEKEKIETTVIVEVGKRPFSEINAERVRVSKCGEHYKVHLPIPLDAYNALKKIPGIIYENNSWLIKGESIEVFFNACRANNIKTV